MRLFKSKGFEDEHDVDTYLNQGESIVSKIIVRGALIALAVIILIIALNA